MNIENQLKELRLQGMCHSWQSLVETRRHHELNLSEGLALLLQAEQQQRTDKRFERLQKNAHFRYQASLQEVTAEASRGLDRSLLSELAMGGYLTKGEAILISGASGAGKTGRPEPLPGFSVGASGL